MEENKVIFANHVLLEVITKVPIINERQFKQKNAIKKRDDAKFVCGL